MICIDDKRQEGQNTKIYKIVICCVFLAISPVSLAAAYIIIILYILKVISCLGNGNIRTPQNMASFIFTRKTFQYGISKKQTTCLPQKNSALINCAHIRKRNKRHQNNICKRSSCKQDKTQFVIGLLLYKVSVFISYECNQYNNCER